MGSEHFQTGGTAESMFQDDIVDTTERSVFGDIQRWKCRKISTRSRREKHVPQITGCCVMPDQNGTVVICDNANSKVKVLDKHRKVIYNDIEVTGCPFDIDSFDEASAVVSIPKNKTVQFLCAYPGLKLTEQKISLSGECYGIAVRNKMIYVCIPDAGIQIVSKRGGVLTCVKCDTAAPMYVYVNADANRIYYSSKEGLVCCVTRAGYSISKYASNKLSNPGSLVADGMDNLLVCNNASCKILKLKPDGTFDKIIPLSSDGSDNAGKFTSMCSNRSCEILIMATATEGRSELLLYEPNDEANDEQSYQQNEQGSQQSSGHHRHDESNFMTGALVGAVGCATLVVMFALACELISKN